MDAVAMSAARGNGSEHLALPELDGEPVSGDERDWPGQLLRFMRRGSNEVAPRLHTTLSCNVRNRRPVLFLPPEMGALQARSLVWLRAFASHHGFGLVEDRRKADVRPIVEQRNRSPSPLALGLSLLLKQSGMPGGARTLSSPHRLNAESLHIDLDELVRMAAKTRGRSKRVVMLPNRLLVEITGEDTHPIVGRACRAESTAGQTVLSQFESPAFRCVGYSTGSQYVMHVFLAGGPTASPELWTRLHTLTHTDFRFRLFPAAQAANDFGLFHTTFYFDVASGEQTPWWLSGEDEDVRASRAGSNRPGRRGGRTR